VLKRSRLLQFIVIAVPLIIIALVTLLNNFIIYLGTILPQCPFYKLTGYYCPGCGNTRSVIHLMKGDIIGSLRYNIAPITLIIILSLLYLELVTYIFGRYKRILTRSSYFWFTVLGLALVYYIVRNFIPHFIS
jgi:hypothetical protein